MTQEWMLKTLIDLGFEKCAAEVYLFLSLNGTKKASAIAEALGKNRQQIYRTLRKLESLQIISGTQKLPKCFTALPFDKTLDLLVKDSLEEAKRMEQNMDDILELWDSCMKKGNGF